MLRPHLAQRKQSRQASSDSGSVRIVRLDLGNDQRCHGQTIESLDSDRSVPLAYSVAISEYAIDWYRDGRLQSGRSDPTEPDFQFWFHLANLSPVPTGPCWTGPACVVPQRQQ